eukprot:COSAG06_NODE_3292_length_5547_cov_22.916483_1_plen_98_part_00
MCCCLAAVYRSCSSRNTATLAALPGKDADFLTVADLLKGSQANWGQARSQWKKVGSVAQAVAQVGRRRRGQQEKRQQEEEQEEEGSKPRTGRTKKLQ